MNSEEHFDYEKVALKMDKLNQAYLDFKKAVEEIDALVYDNINNNSESALYGYLGQRLKHFWEENSLSFSAFYDNYEKWRNGAIEKCMAEFSKYEDAVQTSMNGGN